MSSVYMQCPAREERKRVRVARVNPCRRDTLAMMKLLEVLLRAYP
jgi:hypothetical protein